MPQTDRQLIGRGIAFPPRIDSEGRLAWSEGAAHVRESIRIILSTERRERIMMPEFGGGLRRFLFEPNTPATHRLIQECIKRAVGRWEPRVHVESVQVITDPNEPRGAIATINYRLVATQVSDRVDVKLSLGS
jgi:phage baseplate assembly protein W